jgi:putative CocE/NonD family hydrolase
MLLKGQQNNFKTTQPRVRYYTMGANKWQQAESFPLPNTEVKNFFLSSAGKANSRNGDGALVVLPPAKDNPDAFTYDPMNPVGSYGGNVCCTGNAVQGGSFDQSQMELRNDILVYTSDALAEGIEITGFIESTLFVSSTGPDTDVTIKLIDVYPDGKAYNLDETIQRLRYREGYDKEVFMENNKVYKVDLTPMVTSNYFAPGHKIRIEVSSSNFPRFERNMNTGGNNYDESRGIVVENKIHHSKQYPSVIKLPIIKK